MQDGWIALWSIEATDLWVSLNELKQDYVAFERRNNKFFLLQMKSPIHKQ